MTIYGEGHEVFAPRPTSLAFGVTSFCLIIVSAQLTTLSLSLLDASLAFVNQWKGDWFLYAPLGDSFEHWLFSPTGESYRLLPVVAATAATIVPIVLVYFWPAERAFASLLGIHLFALMLLTLGCLATAFQPSAFLRLQELTGIKAIVWSALIILIGLRVAIAIERRTIELTTNVFSLDSPLQRAKWWAVRLLPALTVLAVLSFLNDRPEGTWAALGVITITLLENLGRLPRNRFTSLKNPRLRESAVLLPIIMLALVAGSIYGFGMEAAGIPPKVLTLTKSREVRHELMASAQQRVPSAGRPRKPGEEPDSGIIEMRWSNPPSKRTGVMPGQPTTTTP